MNVISAKEAKNLGLQKYFTGKPCKNNHITERRVAGRQCIECVKNISKLWVSNNRQRFNEIQRKFYVTHKEQTLKKQKTWQSANKEKYSQITKNYRIANKDKINLYSRIYFIYSTIK
jgi:hypothetical protein